MSKGNSSNESRAIKRKLKKYNNRIARLKAEIDTIVDATQSCWNSPNSSSSEVAVSSCSEAVLSSSDDASVYEEENYHSPPTIINFTRSYSSDRSKLVGDKNLDFASVSRTETSKLTFREKLQKWAVDNKIRHNASNDLCEILRRAGHSELPKYGRMLKHTTQKRSTFSMESDSYSKGCRTVQESLNTSKRGTEEVGDSFLNESKRHRKLPVRFEDYECSASELSPEKRKNQYQSPISSQIPGVEEQSTFSQRYSTPQLPPKNLPDMTTVMHKIGQLESLMHDLIEIGEKNSLHISKLRKELRETRMESQRNRNGQESTSFPFLPHSVQEDFSFPLANVDDLVSLNEKLKENKELQTKLASYLSLTRGKTLQSFLTYILREMVTKDLALKYSRIGRKGKRSLVELDVLYRTILATAAKKFPEATVDDINEKLGKALAMAIDWEGRKKEAAEKIKKMIV